MARRQVRGSQIPKIRETTMSFSLRDFDCQGDSWEDWVKKNILVDALKKMSAYGKKTIKELSKDGHKPILKFYKNFPPSGKTDYKHPKHIAQDATWATLRLSGKVRIAGHAIQNTFYVVFLDRDHRFYYSDKKNT